MLEAVTLCKQKVQKIEIFQKFEEKNCTGNVSSATKSMYSQSIYRVTEGILRSNSLSRSVTMSN